MADTCDTTAAAVVLSEACKSDSVLANDLIETLPDRSISRPESTLDKLNAAAIPPQQISTGPISPDMDKPAVTDAELEKETITFQSNTAETPNTVLTENAEFSGKLIPENSEPKNVSEEIETADTCTDPTLKPLVNEIANPSVTVNSKPLATESDDTLTHATLEPMVNKNPNPLVTENSEPLVTESDDTLTHATLEPMVNENLDPSVTENSESLETENAGTHVTLETLITDNSNPLVTDNSKASTTESAESSVTEFEEIHIQAETIAEEAGAKLDPTENSKLTETSEHKECELPNSTVTEITQSMETEMSIDETPSNEIIDAVKVKLEAEETTVHPTETIISKESEASEQFTGSELETEPIASSATPFIKSEINVAESEDVEMAEPQHKTNTVAETQITETSIAEVDNEKDQTDGDQDELMVQLQTDGMSKGLYVNGDVPQESANEKDVEMGEGEGDGERTVTMLDVLQEQEELEDNADAVLGASDEKNCTYSEGYIKRQALYACLTCCSDAKVDPTKRAGVCLACSLSCHENHDLIELYTKRNFRCDCGNPNFNSQPCTFTRDKPEFNVDNKYNQNFSGLYCICHRPYPDPESTMDDEMIQCVVCEDWLHASHLGATVPTNDQYSEMICKSCMDENEFLHDYTSYVVNIEENEEIDVVNGSEKINGIKDTSLESSEKTQVENSPPTEISVALNSEETSTDETIDSSIKESTDNVPVIGASNEESINKINDSDLADRTVEIDNSIKETASAEVPNHTSATQEADETVNNLTKIFESTESVINNDSTKGINDDDSSKTSTEKTAEEILTVDSTDENTSKNLIEDKTEEITTQDTTEGKVQGSASENAIEQTLDKLPTLGDTEETMHNVSSKRVVENTEDELLTKGSTEEKMDDSSSTHTDTEKIEEPITAIGDQRTEIEMHKKVEEEDRSADNDKSVIVSENTIITTVENELTSQDESKEISSEIAQTGESGNENKTSEEMLQTDMSVAEENIETPSANGGLNAVSPNESKTDDVEYAVDSQTKCIEDAQKEIIPIQTEENTDKHSEHSLENSEQITNDINQDVEMAENDGATLPSETDTKADASETCNSEQLKSTQLVEANIDTDVEMKDHAVTTMLNIDENVSQQQETDQSNVTLPEANKEPTTLAENNETQIAEQQDCTENTNKRKLSSDISEDNAHNKRTKLENGTNEDEVCKRPKFTGKRFKGATFWPCSWRKILCSCHNCVSMYRDKEISFLLDLEDTVSAYEDLGKEKSDGKLSQYEKGLRALSSLDRIQQINALTEYNKMKDELLNFLISFKNRREVVKVEDIEKFFADIKPKKKSDGVYFCR